MEEYSSECLQELYVCVFQKVLSFEKSKYPFNPFTVY